MGKSDCYFSTLAEELEGKRDRMAAILKQAGMSPVVPEGGYFVLADVTALSKRMFCWNTSSISFFFFFTVTDFITSFTSCVDQDLSGVEGDESYDYKFVKWMIKEKVREREMFLFSVGFNAHLLLNPSLVELGGHSGNSVLRRRIQKAV